MASYRLSARQAFASISGVALGVLIVGSGTYAANPEPVTVDVTFVDPITISENNSLQFGLVDTGLAGGDTIAIGTDDSVSESTPRVLGGTQAAADLTVTADPGRLITILVGSITPNTGYTLGSFVCNYDLAGDNACDGAGYTETSVASATLEIGATLTGSGAAISPGTANGSFEVTISYQ